jgi:hypothetical protein
MADAGKKKAVRKAGGGGAGAKNRADRPLAVTLIAAVNGTSALLTLAFWIYVYARLLRPGVPPSASREALASTFGFLVADLVWALPVLAVSVPGLWRMRFWGWAAAQAANVMWIYSLTAVGDRDRFLDTASPGFALFLPFAVFSAWAAAALWRRRGMFRQ